MKQRNNTGASLLIPRIYHQSVKNNATLQCDSRWERDFLTDQEFNPMVKRFMSQPLSFVYSINGKKRRYTGDVRVEFTDGSFADYEIKDKAYANDEKLLAKIEYVSSLLKKHQNSSLTLVTSADIHADPSHVTRKILYPYKYLTINRELEIKALKALYKAQRSIKDLEERFEKQGYERFNAWTFLAKHYSSIVFHGNPNISSSTLISWKVSS
ncbi:MAG: hypothetical protein NWQ54_06995 [Paraglaciecola sp.]|nr:hypothetical protein [Paraglaciecola sp.]